METKTFFLAACFKQKIILVAIACILSSCMTYYKPDFLLKETKPKLVDLVIPDLTKTQYFTPVLSSHHLNRIDSAEIWIVLLKKSKIIYKGLLYTIDHVKFNDLNEYLVDDNLVEEDQQGGYTIYHAGQQIRFLPSLKRGQYELKIVFKSMHPSMTVISNTVPFIKN